MQKAFLYFLLVIICILPVIGNAQTPISMEFWQNKDSITVYIHDTYGKNTFSSLILDVIHKESSFDIYAKNKNSSAVGLLQVLRGTAQELGFSYEEISAFPHLNIECGVKYLKECWKKANYNKKQAIFYYQNGLNCEKES